LHGVALLSVAYATHESKSSSWHQRVEVWSLFGHGREERRDNCWVTGFAPHYLYLQLRRKHIWRSMSSIANISRPAARRCPKIRTLARTTI